MPIRKKTPRIVFLIVPSSEHFTDGCRLHPELDKSAYSMPVLRLEPKPATTSQGCLLAESELSHLHPLPAADRHFADQKWSPHGLHLTAGSAPSPFTGNSLCAQPRSSASPRLESKSG